MTQAQTPPAAAAGAPRPRSVDVAAYVAVLRRRWKFVALSALLGVVVGWFLAPGPAPKINLSGSGRFEATNTVLQNATDSKVSLERVAYLATLGEVPRRVAQKIGYPNDPMLLTSEIQVETDAQVGVIKFKSTETDPALAAQIANTFAAETLAYMADVAGTGLQGQAGDLKTKIDQIDEQIRQNPAFQNTLGQQRDQLSRQLADIETRIGQGTANVDTGLKTIEPAVAREVVDKASPNKLTAKISRPIWVAVIALFVTVLGAAFAILLDRVDRRLRTKDEAKAAYGEAVLAEIPLPGRRDGIALEPQSASAEGMRMLRTVIAATPLDTARAGGGRGVSAATATNGNGSGTEIGSGRSVLVTSAAPGDGKTLTAVNLAMAYTEHQQRVLLVDANLRGPDLSTHFSMAGAPGLAELAQQGAALDGPTVARLCQPTQNPYLFVLPAGLALDRPSSLLHGVRKVLELAPTLCDIVVVDSAALLVANDTRELLDACEGVLLVVTLDQSTAPAAEETRQLLARLSPDVYGIALYGTAGQLGTSMPKLAPPKPGRQVAPVAAPAAPAGAGAGVGEAAATVPPAAVPTRR